MSNSAANARAKSGLTRRQVHELEAVIGQLEGIQQELGGLTKKSPNDAVNRFKLQLVNEVISSCNGLLGENGRPSATFAQFDFDDVPSNSDVTFVLAQYAQALEKLRADNIAWSGAEGGWFFRLIDSDERIRTGQPSKLGRT